MTFHRVPTFARTPHDQTQVQCDWGQQQETVANGHLAVTKTGEGTAARLEHGARFIVGCRMFLYTRMEIMRRDALLYQPRRAPDGPMC